MTTILNAEITSASLTKERGEFLCIRLHLDFADGGSSSWGGHVLGETAPNGYVAKYLNQVLKVCGVDDLADAKGKNIRVEMEGTGSWGCNVGNKIGHIIKDIWLDNDLLVHEAKVSHLTLGTDVNCNRCNACNHKWRSVSRLIVGGGLLAPPCPECGRVGADRGGRWVGVAAPPRGAWSGP